jgi:hypothetical protein
MYVLQHAMQSTGLLLALPACCLKLRKGTLDCDFAAWLSHDVIKHARAPCSPQLIAVGLKGGVIVAVVGVRARAHCHVKKIVAYTPRIFLLSGMMLHGNARSTLLHLIAAGRVAGFQDVVTIICCWCHFDSVAHPAELSCCS